MKVNYYIILIEYNSFEGLSVLHTLEKSPIGGKQIVEYMCKMIREKGYNLHNLKDKDGVRKILVLPVKCNYVFNLSITLL